MVGLVFISHSRPLAEALVELVRQVTAAEIPIAIAAGVGPDRREFGTDAVEIMEAVQAVDSSDGVVLLMDLGSAILSAEMALELLPPEVAARVRFCAAPLVEGAIAAGVQAGLGGDLEAVCGEARQALQPKVEHLEAAAPEPEPPPAPMMEAEGAQEIVLTLRNQHGLHARPAASFVHTAAGFQADIRVSNLNTGKGPVSARSLNGLATLGAVRDHQIRVSASGPEAPLALAALRQLVEANFGEGEPAEPVAPARSVSSSPMSPSPEAPSGAEAAVPVSEGIALGPLFPYRPAPPPIPAGPATDPQVEWNRLKQALEETRKTIQQRSAQLASSIGKEQAAIFDAHLLITEDPDLLEGVRARIFGEGQNAAAAWDAGIQAVVETYRELPDPYLQQRAADVRDVGDQVLFALAGRTAGGPVHLPEPVILFAHEITPTETSLLDMSQVLGLATVGGGPTSHSAILARALGIPAISGANPAIDRLPPGTLIGLDGFSGSIWIDPPAEVQAELQARRAGWLDGRQRLLQTSFQPATLRDGRRLEVAANIGSLQDAQAAVSNGADGVGLLRTEFLYLTRSTPPSEAEQIASLRQIGDALGDRPIIVRTLDVGGDKELPYIHLPPEPNPFLGVRALRLSLRRPELFRTQLRAILRAGVDYRLRVMFPMVANLDEVLEARRWLETVHAELEAEGQPHRWPIETGIMVEIPAAALLSPHLAPHVDFFSIGTNDLTQYTLAAERGNPQLSGLADALHPAVLRLIGQVIDASHAAGKWTGVCGELAGDPLAVPILAGLGVDELSLNPGGIPRIKAILRQIDLESVRPLVAAALQAESAPAVRRLAQDFTQGLSY